MKSSVKIGTRGSRLALWQAEHVLALLKSRNPEGRFEIVVIKTTGDLQATLPVQDIGSKNVFVKEIEEALRDGQIDLAVHSLKDTASTSPKDLVFGAFLGGVSRQDVLITNDNKSWRDLPPGARVASGSLRRVFQLKKLRPDLECVAVRGNVDTRLRKLEEGQFSALILASAGLERLGLTQKISHVFSVKEMVPAGGQGIVAVQLRAGDEPLKTMLSKINDPKSEWSAQVEFAFLREMGAGCDTPLGVLAEGGNSSEVLLSVFVSNVSGEFSLFLQKDLKLSSAEESGTRFGGWVRAEWKRHLGFDWSAEL